MKILSIEYSLNNLSLDIYVSGCKGPYCKGCHNPETWSFCNGIDFSTEYYTSKIKPMIEENEELVENVMVFGGEPFDQDYKSLELLFRLIKNQKKKLWVFTRNELKDLPDFSKELCDVIKTGRFVKDSKKGPSFCGIELASNNQKFNLKSIDF